VGPHWRQGSPEARHAEEAARKAAKLAEENIKRANELKRQGVAGKVALFKYAASDTKDSTKDNMAKIQDQVAKKKAIKQQELEAMAKKKLAEDEIARKKIEAAEAAERAAKAKAEADKASMVKAQKETERQEAEKKKLEAEEERKRAEELSDKKLRDAYEAKKKESEDKARKIKEEEEKKRAAGRALLASKATAFNSGSANTVVKSINAPQKLRRNTLTKVKTGIEQANLLVQITGKHELSKTPGDNNKPSEELTDEARAEYIADQMKKNSISNGINDNPT